MPDYKPIICERTDKAIADWQEQMRSSGALDEPPADLGPLPWSPTGRTGTIGRGLLPEWGVNYAAFLVITMEETMTHDQGMADHQSTTRKLIIRTTSQGQSQLPWVNTHSAS